MTAEESKDLTKYSNQELEKVKEFATIHSAKLLPFTLAEIEMEIARRAPKQVAVAVAPAEESQLSEESNN